MKALRSGHRSFCHRARWDSRRLRGSDRRGAPFGCERQGEPRLWPSRADGTRRRRLRRPPLALLSRPSRPARRTHRFRGLLGNAYFAADASLRRKLPTATAFRSHRTAADDPEARSGADRAGQERRGELASRGLPRGCSTLRTTVLRWRLPAGRMKRCRCSTPQRVRRAPTPAFVRTLLWRTRSPVTGLLRATIAAQDISPDLVDARVQQWMALAKPAHSYDQVASLVGVSPAAADPGQPVRLALNADSTRVAAAAPAPLPAPVASCRCSVVRRSGRSGCPGARRGNCRSRSGSGRTRTRSPGTACSDCSCRRNFA